MTRDDKRKIHEMEARCIVLAGKIAAGKSDENERLQRMIEDMNNETKRIVDYDGKFVLDEGSVNPLNLTLGGSGKPLSDEEKRIIDENPKKSAERLSKILNRSQSTITRHRTKTL